MAEPAEQRREQHARRGSRERETDTRRSPSWVRGVREVACPPKRWASVARRWVTRSAMRRTCSESCDTISTVISPLNDVSVSSSQRAAASSRPLAGSSRISSSGSGSSALASSTRRSSPPDSADSGRFGESAQPHAIEQQRNPLARLARDAETDRTPLPRQRQKIGDGHRQRAIDLKLLRHVRDAAAARPVRDDAPFERHEPQDRRQQRRFACAVRPDEGVQRAALDAEREIRKQRLARGPQREAGNLEQRIFEQEIRRIGVTFVFQKEFLLIS